MQYLCWLWRSHTGPVHTEGLSRPILACSLSQGDDGCGGDGGGVRDDQINPEYIAVFRVRHASGRDPHLLCQRWKNFLQERLRQVGCSFCQFHEIELCELLVRKCTVDCC